MRLPITKGFVVADVQAAGADLEVVLTLKGDSNISVTKTYLGGGITVDAGALYVRLEETDITVAGFYMVGITLTKGDGDVVGVSPCPSKLQFIDQ